MPGGLFGIDGHEEAPAPRTLEVRLPPRLTGLLVGRDGRPAGLDLPSLDVRGVAEPWRAALGKGPFLVRFADREAEPSLERLQRLSRLGEVWVDGPVKGVDGALELLIAGATRLVLWGDDPELLAAVGDAAALGWDGTGDWARVATAAQEHTVPVVAIGAAPTPPPSSEGSGAPGVPVAVYQAPALPWSGAVAIPGTPATVPSTAAAEDEE